MFVLNNLFTEIGKQKSNPILSSHKKQLMHLTFVKKISIAMLVLISANQNKKY